MPYSKILPVVPKGITHVARYLQNAEHEHHQEYKLTEFKFFGVDSVRDFFSRTLSSFSNSLKKLKGRKPKNAAAWYIVRTPDYTCLHPHEKEAYEKAVCEEAGDGIGGSGIYNWHENQLTGASDLNVLASTFMIRGKLIRDRNVNPITQLRRRMDEVTDGLNQERAKKGIEPILTMQEVQKAARTRKNEMEWAEALCTLPSPPRKIAELKPAMIELGWEVTRFNQERDTISFKIPGKKKAHRKSISVLMADILVWLERPEGIDAQDGNEHPEQPKPVGQRRWSNLNVKEFKLEIEKAVNEKQDKVIDDPDIQ